MKIIAKTNHGYMLEASKEEMALLHGFRSTYDGFIGGLLEIGSDLQIAKIDDAARFVRTMDQKKLLRIKDVLNDTIEQIDTAMDTAQSISLLETLKEE